MNRQRWIGLAVVGGIALLLLSFAFNMGVSQGIAQTAQVAAGGTIVGPRAAVPGAAPFVMHPGFVLFGFFGFVFKALLFFGLIVLAVKLFRGGRWRGGWRERAHQRFDDWHRRAHGEEPPAAQPTPTRF
ncbi:MAG: hypothetical protein U0556_17340 [Dehalococcoidia bacterium]